MGNKLLIDGSLFQGRTDIQSWTTEQQSGSGIEVDWGGGDIDILTGETWAISSSVLGAWVVYHNADYYPGFNACHCGLFKVTVTNIGTTSSFIVNGGTSCPALQTTNGYSTSPGAIYANDPNSPPSLFVTGQATRTLACRRAFPNTINNIWGVNFSSGGSTYSRQTLLTARPDSIIQLRYQTQQDSSFVVTTNTGASSSRVQRSAPEISLIEGQGEGCLLNITYTDSKTQTLTYPECPTVSLVEEEVCDQACILADRINAKLGS